MTETTFRTKSLGQPYIMLMGGLHRRPPMALAAPALVRHQGHLLPLGVLSREEWIENLTEAFIGFRTGLSNVPAVHYEESAAEKANTDHQVELLKAASSEHGYEDRYQIARCGYSWQGLPVRQGIELHQEFVTLTSIVDLSRWKPGRRPTPEARQVARALANFNTIAARRHRGVRATADHRRDSARDRAAFADIYQTLYHTVWDQMDAVRGPAGTGLTPFAHAGEDKVGDLFADFRSLLLSRGGAFSAPPGAFRRDLPLESPPFSAREVQRAVETLRPFLTRMPDGEEERLAYTFSTLDGGRVVHGSALGADRRTLQGEAGQGRHEPLTEIFFAAQNNRWPLARLVALGNSLGILRMMSIHQLNEVARANNKLEKLEEQIEEFGRTLSRSGALEKKNEPTDKQLGEFQSNLQTFYRDLAEADEDVPGGLVQRVARSRHY